MELQHLRDVVAEQGQRLEEQAGQLDDLQRRLSYAEDTLDRQWFDTVELGERMEATGAGRLGFAIDGSLCVLIDPPQSLEALAWSHA